MIVCCGSCFTIFNNCVVNTTDVESKNSFDYYCLCFRLYRPIAEYKHYMLVEITRL